MNKTYKLIAVVCITAIGLLIGKQATAQTTNSKIPFQGSLYDQGVEVNGSKSMVFSIAAASWTETHSVQVVNGLYSVVLGSVTPLPANLFTGVDSQQLAITIEGTGIGAVAIYKPFEGDIAIGTSGTLIEDTNGTDTWSTIQLDNTNGKSTTISPAFMRLNNLNGNRAAQLFTNSQGAGALYTYNDFGVNTGWFGNQADKGGLWQIIGDDGAGNSTGAILSGFWGGSPAYVMEDENARQGVTMSMETGGAADKSGLVMTWGPTTPNIEIRGKGWDSNELPTIQMFGEHGDGGGWYKSNAIMEVNSDGTYNWGNLFLQNSEEGGGRHETTVQLDGSDGSLTLRSPDGSQEFRIDPSGISGGGTPTDYSIGTNGFSSWVSGDIAGNGNYGAQINFNGGLDGSNNLLPGGGSLGNKYWDATYPANGYLHINSPTGTRAIVEAHADGVNEWGSIELSSTDGAVFGFDAYGFNGDINTNGSVFAKGDYMNLSAFGLNGDPNVEFNVVEIVNGQNLGSGAGEIKLFANDGSNGIAMDGWGNLNVGNINSGVLFAGDPYDNGVHVNEGAPIISIWSGGSGADDGTETILLNGDSGDIHITGNLTVDGTVSGGGGPVTDFPNINISDPNIMGGQGFASINIVNDGGGGDPSGYSSELFLQGTNTPNFQIGGKPWEDNNLPHFAMFGSTSDGGGWFHSNINMSVDTDGTYEAGNIGLQKTDIAGQTGENTITLDGMNGNIGVIGSISASNFDLNNGVNGYVNMGAKTWEPTNGERRGFLHLSGTEDGLPMNDAQRVFLEVNDNGSGSYGALGLKNYEDDGGGNGKVTIDMNGENGSIYLNSGVGNITLDGQNGNIGVNGNISSNDMNTGTITSGDVNTSGHINMSDPNSSLTLWNNGDGIFMERIFDGVNPQGGHINVAGTGFVDIDGTTGNIDISGAYLNTSDRRFKKNIETIENALDNTLKLRGVSYNWKDSKKTQKTQIGVIAQEVEEVYPEFVHTKKDGYKSVNYAQMTAVLIEAVKELNAKVEALEGENSELKAKLTKVDLLEQQLKRFEEILLESKGDSNPSSLSASK